MTRKKTTDYHGDEEIIQRNVERSRELIEARQRRDEQPELDERNAQQLDTEVEEAPPGQSNIPIGGETNANARGGTSERHKRG